MGCENESHLQDSSPAVKDPTAVPVGRLLAGQSAQVSHVVGRPDYVHRLEEFGLRQGIRIVMFRPGNPCIIRLSGSKICLRSDDLLNVLVTPAELPC